MTRVTVRTVALFAVLLAICTAAAAPASAVAIGDEDGGSTFGDGLRDGDSSSDELTGSSDGTSSGDDSAGGSSEANSTNESTDDGSTGEGSSGTNDDGGSASDSGHWSNRSTNGSSATAAGDSGADGTTENDGRVENRTRVKSPEPIDAAANVSAGVLEALEYDLQLAWSLGEGADRVESALTDGDGASSSLDATPADAERTATVMGSLDPKVDALVDGTSGLVADLRSSITGDGSDDGAPPRVDGASGVGSSAGGASATGTGADGSGANSRLPSDSTTGVAVGIGALAVAGVARNGALLPSGMANLGSALAAGLAPVVGRTRALDRLVRMLAPFRYSRYDDSDPLEHEARADVYEVVNGAPGAYLSKVADRADLPLSTARHHIRVLECEDLVSGAKVRGKRRFYPAYTSGIELAAALDDEATAAVIDAVARFGSASVSDLAAELDRDPSTVSHHLSRLAEDGIVVRERDGRAVINRLSPEARTALEPGRETETDAPEVGEVLASD